MRRVKGNEGIKRSLPVFTRHYCSREKRGGGLSRAGRHAARKDPVVHQDRYACTTVSLRPCCHLWWVRHVYPGMDVCVCVRLCMSVCMCVYVCEVYCQPSREPSRGHRPGYVTSLCQLCLWQLLPPTRHTHFPYTQGTTRLKSNHFYVESKLLIKKITKDLRCIYACTFHYF